MSEIALAKINSFASPAMQVDIVPPSEEAVFILTSGQLKDLIKEAIQPLQDEVSQLRATVASQGEEIAAMRVQVRSLESLQEQDVTRLACDIAQDRRRLAALEHPAKEPGKTEISRAEKIEKYLSSRPDHKATFETLKGHLGIDKDLLNDAIKTLMGSSPGRYGITRTPGDKRKRTLIMLPK